jgi:hypothetical protein
VTTGFVQLNPDVDATGKQLDNDVVTIPVGTVLTDGSGNQTTLAAPAFYFRERVVNADPNDPRAVAAVRNADGPNANDYALATRLPRGQADLQAMLAVLMDMDAQLASIAGNAPLSFGGGVGSSAQYLFPAVGIPPGRVSPDVPRPSICDIFGRIITLPYGSREAQANAAITITSTTAAQTLVAAQGNNIFADLQSVILTNTSATATEVDVSDGTQTIPFYVPAGDMRGISQAGGILIKATNPNVAWTATTLTSVASVKVWCNYMQHRVN